VPIRTAEAVWKGTLKEGKGHLKLQSGVYEGPYTWASRFADGKETNPEELIAAAHASCYAMFLSSLLTNNGFNPESLQVKSLVHLVQGPTVAKLELHLEARVQGLSQEKFDELAQEARAKCPISKALAAVPEMTLEAKLL